MDKLWKGKLETVHHGGEVDVGLETLYLHSKGKDNKTLAQKARAGETYNGKLLKMH